MPSVILLHYESIFLCTRFIEAHILTAYSLGIFLRVTNIFCTQRARAFAPALQTIKKSFDNSFLLFILPSFSLAVRSSMNEEWSGNHFPV
jgi:hypothetical protein